MAQSVKDVEGALAGRMELSSSSNHVCATSTSRNSSNSSEDTVPASSREVEEGGYLVKNFNMHELEELLKGLQGEEGEEGEGTSDCRLQALCLSLGGATVLLKGIAGSA